MVYVREDGEVWGEILTQRRVRFLPEDFQLEDACRFFDIPHELQQHQVAVQPHPEEVILALKESSGRAICSFLKSQLSESCSLRAALDELVHKLQKILAPEILPNAAASHTS
jgi:hypothetical protein